MIEFPFGPIIEELNQQPLSKVALHFFQLQGPDAIGTINLE